MAPLSARRRNGGNAAAVVSGLMESGGRLPVPPLGTGGVASDVQVVALTPRSLGGATPRPVVRGPAGGRQDGNTMLSPEEESRAEKAFRRHDQMGMGEVDMNDFFALCESLDLPVDVDVASEWIGGRSEAKGLNLDDFKSLYGRVLAAQSPAVRKINGQESARLPELSSTEANMRVAFRRYAGPAGKLDVDVLPQVFQYLRFPDHHGDGFDRFVGECLLLAGKDESSSLNFHEFAASVNLLIDFCEKQRGPPSAR